LLSAYAFAGPFSMNFIFTMMMLVYSFKGCETYYKDKYPEYAMLLLFNYIMTFVS
jgi:hypothetical protein